MTIGGIPTMVGAATTGANTFAVVSSDGSIGAVKPAPML